MAILVFIQTASAETVHSLAQVPHRLKTPEAKQFFSAQIEGKPAPDLLGTHLPGSLSASVIAGLLLPSGNQAKPTLIGAKPWPRHADLYVAIVCAGGGKPSSPDEPRCARSNGGAKELPLHVYLGIIAAKNGATPAVVAASGPIDCAIDWSNTDLPQTPMATDDAKDGLLRPDSFDGFDLARFRIAPDQFAFGLRVGWTESYSGGGASFTALCLFAQRGEQLKQVLAVPMSAYSDIAGDWHKDQTRDHDVTEAANVLIVSSHETEGHFDLIVKGRNGRSRQLFRWSQHADAYRQAAK